jgi:flagellar FliL protein
MATADKKVPEEIEDDEEEKKEAPASRFSRFLRIPSIPSKKVLIIAAAVLALVVAGVGGAMLFTDLFGTSAPVKKAAKKNVEGEDEGEAKEADAKDTDAKEDEKDKPEGDAEPEDETNPDGTPKPAVYTDFEQPFVVNFQDEGQLRYLQITVAVMSKNPKVVENLKRHMPLIRNNLVMLFSGQSREGLISREGKEKIRKEAEAEVQKILKEQTGAAGVKALYFTSFVMQ